MFKYMSVLSTVFIKSFSHIDFASLKHDWLAITFYVIHLVHVGWSRASTAAPGAPPGSARMQFYHTFEYPRYSLPKDIPDSLSLHLLISKTHADVRSPITDGPDQHDDDCHTFPIPGSNLKPSVSMGTPLVSCP